MVLGMAFFDAPLDRTPRQAIYRLLMTAAKPCFASFALLGGYATPLGIPAALVGAALVVAAWRFGHPERWPLDASGDPP
jgi:hypothetical protein